MIDSRCAIDHHQAVATVWQEETADRGAVERPRDVGTAGSGVLRRVEAQAW
ncbi:MAG: hypothetical protein OXG04_10650 [Acidobacteria bacterium]|nr:hypothetical protein [Acidobacteriota bacterium]